MYFCKDCKQICDLVEFTIQDITFQLCDKCLSENVIIATEKTKRLVKIYRVLNEEC